MRTKKQATIVWLDRFKPENGQRGFDFASEFSRRIRIGQFTFLLLAASGFLPRGP